MSRKVLLWGVVLLLAVGVLGVVFPRPVARVVERLGAFPGTEISGNDFKVGGVTYRSFSSGLSQASTSICAFKPAASSTLISGSVSINTGSSSGFALEVGRALKNNTATSNRLALRTGLSTADAVILFPSASTTESETQTANPKHVFGPNDWLVVKTGFGSIDPSNNSVGFSSLVGSCTAQFQLLK